MLSFTLVFHCVLCFSQDDLFAGSHVCVALFAYSVCLAYVFLIEQMKSSFETFLGLTLS